MPRSAVMRAAIAGALAVLAAVGFFLFVPVHRPNPMRLAVLAITGHVRDLDHPRTDVPVPSASPLAAVRAAAASTPGEAGAYAVDWKGKSPVSTASLLVAALPTVSEAKSARADAVAGSLQQSSFTAAGYGYGGAVNVPSVPGADGAYYLRGTSPMVTAKTPRATAVVFRVDRVLVDVTVQATGDAATSTAQSLADAEYRHLGRVGAAPVLGMTSVPLVASIVYAVVALAVIACAQAAPVLVSDVVRRRHEAREEAVRRERVARGKKVVKRHASHGYAAKVQARAHGRR